MAKPPKTGLDYYNVDTDVFSNVKVRRVIKTFGAKGWLVYSFLLTEIYRDKGCFIEWGNNTAFDVSDRFNLKESLVIEIVGFCCNVGLFNKEVLANENVLTTKNIQEFWLLVSKKAKRKIKTVNSRFSLIKEDTPLNREVIPLNREFIPLTKEDTPQRKGKESKLTLTLYSESAFLKFWNRARVHFENIKQSNISKLTTFERVEFNQLINDFNQEDFENGIRGLFKQKEMFPANRLRPKHFLSDRNIEKYIDCEVNNKQLFEDKKKQARL